jgi:hypothetical protein
MTGADALPTARPFVASTRSAGVSWIGLLRPVTVLGFRTPDARTTITMPTAIAASDMRSVGDCQADLSSVAVSYDVRADSNNVFQVSN